MDLIERKRRLKMFLEFESDKEMLAAFVTFSNNSEEFQKLSEEEQLEAFGKHFSFMVSDESRVKRLSYCGGLVRVFLEAAVVEDDLSADEAVRHANEVLNQLCTE